MNQEAFNKIKEQLGQQIKNDILLYGNSYWEITRNQQGKITQLTWLDPITTNNDIIKVNK
jgi:phage portal protein BeeE